MDRWTEDRIPDQKGTRVLVTGAASGIGFDTAAGLARHGATVLLADRNIAGGEAAINRIRQQSPDANVEFRPLDLAALASIHRFAADIARSGRPLDVLVNNAGILPPLERRTTADGFELTFGISCLGHYALTALLLPALLKSATPRVVTISSIAHHMGSVDFDDLQATDRYNTERAYNQAKLASLIFAQELQRRSDAAQSRLLSLAVHPGVARTGLAASRIGQKRRLKDHLVDVVLALVMKWFGQSSELGALPSLYAATSPEVVRGGFYGPDGWRELAGYPTRARVSASACDLNTARRLWTVFEQLTGVTCHFQ